MSDSKNKKQVIHQTGGGLFSYLGKIFMALLIVVVVVVAIVFGIAVVMIKLLRNNPLTQTLTTILCRFTGSTLVTLVSGILEIVVLVFPPLAAIVIPALKAIDTYTLACGLLMDNNLGFLDHTFGVIALLPIAGSLGKFAKVYNNWFAIA